MENMADSSMNLDCLQDAGRHVCLVPHQRRDVGTQVEECCTPVQEDLLFTCCSSAFYDNVCQLGQGVVNFAFIIPLRQHEGLHEMCYSPPLPPPSPSPPLLFLPYSLSLSLSLLFHTQRHIHKRTSPHALVHPHNPKPSVLPRIGE
jgi:hypothetical protein